VEFRGQENSSGSLEQNNVFFLLLIVRLRKKMTSVQIVRLLSIGRK